MTLLVADDNEEVLKLVRTLVERDGHCVLPASNGLEALVLAQVHGEEVDLLLTDLCMPGIGGLELAQAVRQMRPQVRVIYMTGYSEQQFGCTEEVLRKPFLPGTLKSAIERSSAPSRV